MPGKGTLKFRAVFGKKCQKCQGTIPLSCCSGQCWIHCLSPRRSNKLHGRRILCSSHENLPQCPGTFFACHAKFVAFRRYSAAPKCRLMSWNPAGSWKMKKKNYNNFLTFYFIISFEIFIFNFEIEIGRAFRTEMGIPIAKNSKKSRSQKIPKKSRSQKSES